MQKKIISKKLFAMKQKNIIALLQIILSIFVIFCICLYVSPIFGAKVYKWKDDQGHTHFTDDLQKVPEEARAKFVESEYKPTDTNNSPDKKVIEENVNKKEVENEEILIPFK